MGKQLRQSDIEQSYRDEFYFRFEITPTINIKEKSLFGRLIKELGHERANNLILNTMKHWKVIKSRNRKIVGFPNIGFIWGWRLFLIDILKEKNGTDKRKITKNDSGNTEARTYFDS